MQPDAFSSRVDRQTVAEHISEVMKIHERSEMIANRATCNRSTGVTFSLGNGATELQNRSRVEIGKSPKAFFIHPPQEMPQPDEMAGDCARSLREA